MNEWRRVGPGQIPWVVWVFLFAANAMPWLLFSLADLIALDDRLVSRAGMLWGRDFSNQWLGGKLALAGLNVYDNAAYQDAIAAYGATAHQNYSYPPHALLLGAGLAHLPYGVALFAWAAAGSTLLYRAARPYVPFSPWLVLIVPSVARIPYGQFGLLASALFLLGMRGSGMAAGLLTMKPHLGILLAPALLAKRRFRQILAALAVTAALLIAAEWMFGLGAAFLDQGLKRQASVMFNPLDAAYFNVMPSAYVALRHTGFEWAGQAIAATAAVAMLWGFRSASMKQLAFPLSTATFIVLPYSFAYDMALVSIGFAVILYRQWAALSRTERGVAMIAFSTPNLVATHLVPLFLLAGLWLQLTVWRRETAIQAAPSEQAVTPAPAAHPVSPPPRRNPFRRRG